MAPSGGPAAEHNAAPFRDDHDIRAHKPAGSLSYGLVPLVRIGVGCRLATLADLDDDIALPRNPHSRDLAAGGRNSLNGRGEIALAKGERTAGQWAPIAVARL